MESPRLTRLLRSDVLLIALVWAVGTLPFLSKAFTVDDPFYLAAAEQVRRDPLRPYAFEWDGREVWTLHPPLVPYVLAAAISLDGGREEEAVLHLALSAFQIIAGFALVSIARRFGASPPLLVVLGLLGPTVLPGANVMLDTPVLALSLAALALHIRGVDRGSRAALVAGGVAAGLAMLAKYNAAVFVALMGAYSLLARRPRSVLALLIPALAMVALGCATLVTYVSPHLARPPPDTPTSAALLLHRPIVDLAIIGASSLWALLAFRRDRPFAAIVALAIVAGGLFASGSSVAEHFFFLANGAIAIVAALRGAIERARECPRDRHEDVFLATWALSVLVFGWTFAYFPAARHDIAAIPPLVLLIARRRPTRVPQVLAAALTILLGLAIARADAEWANGYRDFAAAVRIPRGQRGFYTGSWGWAYYARRAGLAPLPSHAAEIHPADRLYVPLGLPRPPVAAPIASRWTELLHTTSMPRRWPIRTMEAGHGPYLGSLHEPPYAFSRAPLETFAEYAAN